MSSNVGLFNPAYFGGLVERALETATSKRRGARFLRCQFHISNEEIDFRHYFGHRPRRASFTLICQVLEGMGNDLVNATDKYESRLRGYVATSHCTGSYREGLHLDEEMCKKDMEDLRGGATDLGRDLIRAYNAARALRPGCLSGRLTSDGIAFPSERLRSRIERCLRGLELI